MHTTAHFPGLIQELQYNWRNYSISMSSKYYNTYTVNGTCDTYIYACWRDFMFSSFVIVCLFFVVMFNLRYVDLVTCKYRIYAADCPLGREGQTITRPNTKVQKNNQRSTNITHKSKCQITRSPLKTGGAPEG